MSLSRPLTWVSGSWGGSAFTASFGSNWRRGFGGSMHVRAAMAAGLSACMGMTPPGGLLLGPVSSPAPVAPSLSLLSSRPAVQMTKVADRTISDDLEYLISKTVDTNKADYAVVTGIQIHNWGADFRDESPNMEFVQVTSAYVVVDGQKTHLDIASLPVSSSWGSSWNTIKPPCACPQLLPPAHLGRLCFPKTRRSSIHRSPPPCSCPAAHDPPPDAPGGRPRLRLQPGWRDHAA